MNNRSNIEDGAELVARLDSLRKERVEVIDAIQRLQQELARIEFAIGYFMGPAHRAESGVSLTPDGHIRDLEGHILRTLKRNQKVMTAGELAMELYDPVTMRITAEQLRRRLSVKTSAMYKDRSGVPKLVDSGKRNHRREVYWALPSWMIGGRIDMGKIPDGVL